MQWVDIIHNECCGVALQCKDREYVSNEMIVHSDFRHVDGTLCSKYEQPMCNKCGKDVSFSLYEGSISAVTLQSMGVMS